MAKPLPKQLAVPQPSGLSPAEFAERFQRDTPTLSCLAAAVSGDAVLAEDILQEAAMIALERLEAFERHTNFAAWMAQIVRYVALNSRKKAQRVRRSQGRDPATLHTPKPLPAPSPSLVERGALNGDRELFDELLVAALEQLSDTARSCLLLKTVVGLEYTEIAAVLGIPEGTAMSHVHRARTRTRRYLEALRQPTTERTHP